MAKKFISDNLRGRGGWSQFDDIYYMQEVDVMGRPVYASLGEANASAHQKPERLNQQAYQGTSKDVSAEIDAQMTAYRSNIDPKGA